MTDRDEEARERESREALERVRRDSETVGSSSMARPAAGSAITSEGRDAVGEDGTADPIEVWGRRIGRSLSIIAFIGLSLWLAHQLRLF